MLRRLFTFASVLSLLICTAILLEWLRGYWVADDFVRDSYPVAAGFAWRRSAEVEIQGGTVTLKYTVDGSPITTATMTGVSWHWGTDEYPARSNRFNWPRGGGPANARLRVWTFRNSFLVVSPQKTVGAHSNLWLLARFPIWPLAGSTALLPTCWAIMRLLRRSRPGLCPTCSYNLTGNTSGICPECGTTVESKSMPSKIRDISN